MNPWRGGETDQVPGSAFWGGFVLYWLVVSGLGTLLLFLFYHRFFSSPVSGGYGAVFYALRHLSKILFSFVALSMLAYVFLAGAAAAWLCITCLHKVAGPLFKLERALGSYLDGEPVKPLFFRHGDLVPELASAFNRFAGRLREDRQRWLGVMENADRFCLQDRQTCRAEREKALAELETLLFRYR